MPNRLNDVFIAKPLDVHPRDGVLVEKFCNPIDGDIQQLITRFRTVLQYGNPRHR